MNSRLHHTPTSSLPSRLLTVHRKEEPEQILLEVGFYPPSPHLKQSIASLPSAGPIEDTFACSPPHLCTPVYCTGIKSTAFLTKDCHPFAHAEPHFSPTFPYSSSVSGAAVCAWSPTSPCPCKKPGCPGILPVSLYSFSGNDGPKNSFVSAIHYIQPPKRGKEVGFLSNIPKVGCTSVLSSKMSNLCSCAQASIRSQFLHSCSISKSGFGARSFGTQSNVRRDTSALHTGVGQVSLKFVLDEVER